VSTILKALKRLDEQKRAESAPRTLEEQVLGARAHVDPDARRNKWLFAVAGFAAVLLAAGASWIALRAEPEPPASVAPAPASAPAQRAASVFEQRSAQPSAGIPRDAAIESELSAGLRVPPAREESVAGAAVPRADQPESEALAPSQREERADIAVVPPEAAPPLVAQMPSDTAIPRRREPTRAAPNTSAESDVASRMENAPAALPEQRPRTPVAAAEPASEPAARAADAEAEAPAEPLAAAASVAAAPPVRVDRTQWHPAPERRSALVRVGAEGQPRELREGDAVDGVVVKEIRPSGVVFLYAGSEFRRGVGAD
jgi:hypothetical protein